MKMFNQLIRLTFPAHCVACQTEGDWVCEKCRKKLEPSPTELCRICGQLGKNGLCETCHINTGLDGLVSLFKYSDPVIETLISTSKKDKHSDALKFFASRYRTQLLGKLPYQEWTLSFVPLSRTELAERGFNQAELLAQILSAKEFKLQSLFKKNVSTPEQTKLSLSQREKNLRKVFSLKASAPTHLVICDDFIGTGTTLSRLANLAKKKGAQEVWGLTFAHQYSKKKALKTGRS